MENLDDFLDDLKENVEINSPVRYKYDFFDLLKQSINNSRLRYYIKDVSLLANEIEDIAYEEIEGYCDKKDIEMWLIDNYIGQIIK